MKPSVAAIVLAAGTSSRMGRPKLLLPLDGGAIIDETIRNVCASKASEVMVVLGERGNVIADGLARTRARAIFNPDFASGMASSIVAGVRAASPAADAFMIVLGDQPRIGPDVLDRLITALGTGARSIVLPVYKERRGHPVILSSRYRDDLLALAGDCGARGIIASHPEDVLEVPVETPAVIEDIDTPEDYRRMIRECT